MNQSLVCIAFKGCGSSNETIALLRKSIEDILNARDTSKVLDPYIWENTEKGIPYDVMISIILSNIDGRIEWNILADLSIFFRENPIWAKCVQNISLMITEFIPGEMNESGKRKK